MPADNRALRSSTSATHGTELTVGRARAMEFL